jgi:hypothetical protein
MERGCSEDPLCRYGWPGPVDVGSETTAGFGVPPIGT